MSTQPVSPAQTAVPNSQALLTERLSEYYKAIIQFDIFDSRLIAVICSARREIVKRAIHHAERLALLGRSLREVDEVAMSTLRAKLEAIAPQYNHLKVPGYHFNSTL
eukprot:SAG31_NODE_291_length_18308_cov_6.463013_2_plen_107_part_00